MREVRNNLLGSLFLLLFISNCSSIDANYRFPTGKQQRVLELCALVFTEPHYQHISPSRKVKLNRLRTTSGDSGRHLRMGAHTKYPLLQDFRKEKTITATTFLCLLHAHHGMTGMKDVIGTILIIPIAFSRVI